MATINRDWDGDWTEKKIAPWWKVWWCGLRHIKKYKIYPVYSLKNQSHHDVKVYGCMKCNIWRRVE